MSKIAIELDGTRLTRREVADIAAGSSVILRADALARVEKAANFLATQVRRGEPVYGVTTGFGSNADKLLGAHRVRDELPESGREEHANSLLEELQENLIITHAVCVGKPFSREVVRAMLAIRINTLLRGHSGIRVSTLQALMELLNRDVTPVVPEKGSVGASGDLAPLSHLAIVLLGGGEAFVDGERMSGADALKKVGLEPVKLSFKEGLALNNGTAQMLATAVLALDRMEYLISSADLAAAMTLDAFAGRSGALRPEVHALRPHPGQVESAAHLRELIDGSTLVDIPYHMVPRFRSWTVDAWSTPEQQAQRFDIAWDWVPPSQRHGREAFYARFQPFRGGKKHQPQDAYCLRCAPQVHGAVRDAWSQACRVIDIELNAVTDNPLVFPDPDDEVFAGGKAAGRPNHIEDQVVSAGHFHGMPLALVMSYLKTSIPVLASISERRL
ncbi:MAG: aromatic amino acid ammonia-lyase, partial [Dokdonella sp.]